MSLRPPLLAPSFGFHLQMAPFSCPDALSLSSYLHFMAWRPTVVFAVFMFVWPLSLQLRFVVFQLNFSSFV